MIEQHADREVVLEREMPFPPELVWKAITIPEHMRKWWGPDGFTIENPMMDLKIGGSWSFVMIGPDGTRFPNHSVFKEIEEPTKLVFDHGDGERVWFEAGIHLQRTTTGTLVRLRHLFPDAASRELVVTKYGAIEGGKQHLAKMEAYVRANLA